MERSEGAGARLAWRRESARVHAEVSQLLSPFAVELLDYESGCVACQSILDRFRQAQDSRLVLGQQFQQELAFDLAVQLAWESLDDQSHVTILLQESETRGVYRTTLQALRRKALALLRLDGNSIIVAPEHQGRGYLLDRELGEGGEEILELEVWTDAGA